MTDVPAVEILSEQTLRSGVDLLVRLVEAAGALVIFVGAAMAAVRFVVAGLRSRRAEVFVPVRLGLGRFLALGLEFQLAGDILRTAIAPSFAELGKLGAVAAIRTALNFFLAREISQEAATVREQRGDAATAHAAATAPHPTDPGQRGPLA